MIDTEDLLICTACGAQYDIPASEPLKSCRICDDPRQFVPPGGQTWTSLAAMRGSYHNNFTPDAVESRMTNITTEPKFGIGQRCILLETSAGNVLWDCIAYLDDKTIDLIKGKGGLKAIVISHPHFYTTHLHWAEVFDCPVYFSAEDEGWTNRVDSKGRRILIQGVKEEIMPGVEAVKVGGHFPGSLVLSWEKELLVADTIMAVPSAYYHIDRPPGTASYAFMWSIPNMIPLPPSTILSMWKVLETLDFESTHGVFVGSDVRDKSLKVRVLESMKIQIRAMGWQSHEMFDESIY